MWFGDLILSSEAVKIMLYATDITRLCRSDSTLTGLAVIGVSFN